MSFRLALLFCATLFGTGGPYCTADGAAEQSEPKVSITSRSARTLERSGPRSSNLRLDVNVVLVPVTVTDPLGKPITDIPRERFHLTEDGVEQNITSFLQEDSPVSVGLLFDTSGSMKNRIEASVGALKLF